jgi:hypothetical protein
MKNYLAYWKRGWWALGLIISINIILGVVYAGLAFLLRPLLANPFPVAVAVAWLIVGAPIAGLLFEKFVGWSNRLDQSAQHHGTGQQAAGSDSQRRSAVAHGTAAASGKDMEQPMALAKERMLTLEDVGLVGADVDQVKRFCDTFARNLVERYLREEISWVDGDAIANNYFQLMIRHCGREMPAYAWDVYLAFDEGEIQDRGDTFTRARVRELQTQYGYA